MASSALDQRSMPRRALVVARGASIGSGPYPTNASALTLALNRKRNSVNASRVVLRN